MLKNKFPILILTFLVLSGCTLFKKKTNLKPEIKTSYLQRVYINFEKGKELLFQGKLDASNYYFDRALNILLDSNINNVKNSKYIKDLITKISSVELNHLKYIEEINSKKEKALIDEVINTPLFKPSKKEVQKLKKLVINSEPEFSFPIVINSKVVSFLKAFQTIRHKSIQNSLNRATAYLDDFRAIFRERGVPEDLIYLPIIESGFRVNALSRARALGVWQFMRATAKLFGLRSDWIVDERRNPYKAAYAAAKYLKYLHDQFGDWYLALASYNGGPGRVRRAIRKVGSRDFFRLARTRYLRRETRNYVPAFIASLLIAKSPEKYGFEITKVDNIFDSTKIVEINSPVKLKNISSLLNISFSLLKKLNPELVREFTPFNKKKYLIRIPSASDETVLSDLKILPPKSKYFAGWYRVKRGDNLYSIARRFKTTVRKIKKVNKLRSNLIKPGKRLLIPRGFY
ncbi:MAG: transglycosylase SLT domain-containing protein [Acidobacteriota bacterium]